MLGFMDLMWPRVFRRSNIGLVEITVVCQVTDFDKEIKKVTCERDTRMFAKVCY